MNKKALYLGISSIAYVGFGAAFFNLRSLLTKWEIEYRFWLSALGYILLIMIPMVLIVLWICFGFSTVIRRRTEQELSVRGCRIAQAAVLVAFSVLCAGILFFAGIFGLFTMHEERITEDGTLQVMYGGFPGESYGYEYDKVSFWGRKPSSGLAARDMLEEKYHCSFEIYRGAMDIGWLYFIPENDPELSVTVYDVAQKDDDYVECYLADLFSKGRQELKLTSESNMATFETSHNEFFLYQTDRPENRKILAHDGAVLISYALDQMSHDDNAPCHEGVLHLVLTSDDGNRQSIRLLFGESEELQASGFHPAAYTIEGNVYQRLMELPVMPRESVEDSTADENSEEAEYPEETAEEEEPSWDTEIKRLAKLVYDDQLAETENHFEMTYNAKGNPYAILGGEEKELPNGQTIQTRRTLVYDRTSQNGKCELFVYYVEKYDLDGNQLDTTEILNMYAIDKESLKVYPSDKHAWADVGNKEYREAVGE